MMESESEVTVKQELTSDCGHHCGVQMMGLAKYVGHCDCPECHAGKAPPTTQR